MGSGLRFVSAHSRGGFLTTTTPVEACALVDLGEEIQQDLGKGLRGRTNCVGRQRIQRRSSPTVRKASGCCALPATEQPRPAGPHSTPCALVITAPEPLRTQLSSLSSAKPVTACARLQSDLVNRAGPPRAKLGLHTIAPCVRYFDAGSDCLRMQLDQFTHAAAPATRPCSASAQTPSLRC